MIKKVYMNLNPEIALLVGPLLYVVAAVVLIVLAARKRIRSALVLSIIAGALGLLFVLILLTIMIFPAVWYGSLRGFIGIFSPLPVAFLAGHNYGFQSLEMIASLIVTLFLWAVIIIGFVLAVSGAKSDAAGEESCGGQISAPANSVPSSINSLALASIIVVWFSSIAGIIIAHVALAQIKRTGSEGRGMALAAMVIGWTVTGFTALGLIVMILFWIGITSSTI